MHFHFTAIVTTLLSTFLAFTTASPVPGNDDHANLHSLFCTIFQDKKAHSDQCALTVSWNAVSQWDSHSHNPTVSIYDYSCKRIAHAPNTPIIYQAPGKPSDKIGHVLRLNTPKGTLRVTDLWPDQAHSHFVGGYDKNGGVEFPNLQGLWKNDGGFQHWISPSAGKVSDKLCTCKKGCMNGFKHCCACIFNCPG